MALGNISVFYLSVSSHGRGKMQSVVMSSLQLEVVGFSPRLTFLIEFPACFITGVECSHIMLLSSATGFNPIDAFGSAS
jgi:hypothetical protein